MSIGEIIKKKDYDTYRKLMRMCKKPKKKDKEIKLGDSVTNLMKANAYKRQGRRVHQTRWG